MGAVETDARVSLMDGVSMVSQKGSAKLVRSVKIDESLLSGVLMDPTIEHLSSDSARLTCRSCSCGFNYGAHSNTVDLCP